MSEAIYSTFGVTFLASPLGEGERTACRAVAPKRAAGSKAEGEGIEACYAQLP